jgi:hypothetical protein
LSLQLGGGEKPYGKTLPLTLLRVINPCHLHDPNGMSQPDDKTKTLSKHGGSLCYMDALLAEVSDLRDEHRRLRLEVQHLQEEKSHARDTEARVRGELEAFKTRVAELSQNNTPPSNYQPGVRSHGTHPGVTPETVTHVVRDIPLRATPPRPMTRRNSSQVG